MKPVTFDDIDVTIVRARRDLWVAVAGESETTKPDTVLAAQTDNPPPYTGKGADPNAALDDLRERWTAWVST